jgi:hypothetical protein
VFVCLGIYPKTRSETCLATYPEICPIKKILKKYGLPEFMSGPPLGGGPNENSGRL